MDKKPIIRHCKNCKYSTGYYHVTDILYCSVKYDMKLNGEQRICALLCKYYKQKEGVPSGNERTNA